MAKVYIVVTESTIIHGVPLGANTHHVAVITTIDPEACLPIPIGDEFVYIKEVFDTMVPWPKHLVFLLLTFYVFNHHSCFEANKQLI